MVVFLFIETSKSTGLPKRKGFTIPGLSTLLVVLLFLWKVKSTIIICILSPLLYSFSLLTLKERSSNSLRITHLHFTCCGPLLTLVALNTENCVETRVFKLRIVNGSLFLRNKVCQFLSSVVQGTIIYNFYFGEGTSSFTFIGFYYKERSCSTDVYQLAQFSWL